MPKPRVHEIFSNQNQPAATNTSDSKQHGGLTTKKSFAPMPPMSRFGGYKPKILAGADEFIPVGNDDRAATSPPTSPPNALPRPVLTKPKPFIIGDKDVPMILSTPEDVPDEKNNNLDTNIVQDLNIYESVDDIDTNKINHDGSQFQFQNDGGEISRLDSPVRDDNAFFEPNDTDDLIEKESTTSFSSNFATENPAFTAAPEHPEDEHVVDGQAVYENGVHIPEPDYDEDERTLDFAEEDPDDLVADRQPSLEPKKGHTLPPLSSRVYVGEDYSHYLSDDEEEMSGMTSSRISKGKKQLNGKLNQKHSMFKYPSDNGGAPISNNNNNTSKSKSKVKSPVYNNVRSFSYADSKYGTKGRAKGQVMTSMHQLNDGDNFQDDSYESFLFSRHGHTMPSRIPAVDTRDVERWNDVKADDERLWKKLTFRLKNKFNKNGYAVKEI